MPAGRNSKRGATRPTTTRKQPRKAAAQLPGEKAVRRTAKTVPVASRKVSRAEKKPLGPRPSIGGSTFQKWIESPLGRLGEERRGIPLQYH